MANPTKAKAKPAISEISGNVIRCANCQNLVPVALTCSNCRAPLRIPQAASTRAYPFAATPAPVETLESSDLAVKANMDPRLQRTVVRSRQKGFNVPTSSTAADEVAVIAKVTDVNAWESLSEVRTGATIGSDRRDNTTLVTARIPASRVESVHGLPFIKSLKPARRLRPVLTKTIEETAARQDLLPNGNLGEGGRGAIVGIVDFGCDFMHQNFRLADGRSRILALWDQNGASDQNSPFGFGKLYTKAEIDAALNTNDPYATLGYEPPKDSLFEKGTHGTHVMDIAAGNGRGSGVPGMAPRADIIFVDIAASDVPWDGPAVVGSSFGDSVHLLEAVRFIFDRAANRPCAVNLSLGTNGGPHDGSTLVELGLDNMITQMRNRAVVLAASNSFSDGIHAAGTVAANGQTDLVWQIPANDVTGNELEIWYSGQDRMAVEVIAPDGSQLIRVEPGQSRALNSGPRTVLLVANRLGDPNNNDNNIGLFLESDLPEGDWTIRLHGVSIQDGSFHAWIERDDPGQSSFAPPHDNSHTLGSISCGRETVVVGSYDAHKNQLPLSFFSSAGPTRDNRQKPELSAPGHDVLAAHSRTLTGVTRKSGTSMAAPAVTGLIALMLSEAGARTVQLTSQQIRQLVTQTARKNPPATAAWDPRFGMGRISAAATVAAVIAMRPAQPVAAAAARPAAKPKRLTTRAGKKAKPRRRPRL